MFRLWLIPFLLLSTCVFGSDSVKISWQKADAKMRHFRTFSDLSEIKDISHKGILNLPVSGSGQFSKENLMQLVQAVKASDLPCEKILVIDLREEPHGFLNGLPVILKLKERPFFFPEEELIAFEVDLLQRYLEGQNFVELKGETEKEIVLSEGLEYIRFPVLDHSHPKDPIVEKFIEIVLNEPKTWIHVHCSAGKGRTTTFLAMADIIYNAKELSLNAILLRQKCNDGQDLRKYEKDPHYDPSKRKLYDGRLAFLKKFHTFCKENDLSQVSWSNWNASQS